MDLKKHILNSTFQLIFNYGISSVTMDYIAKECGISKRTLYEHFSDKSTLVISAIKLRYEEQQLKFQSLYNDSPNQMIALLRVFTYLRKYLTNVSPAFFIDMERLYPQVANEYKYLKSNRIDRLKEVLNNGKDEGVFLHDINSEVVSLLFFTELQIIKNNKDYNLFNISYTDIYDTFFLCFVRGIATDKGLDIINEYFKSREKQNINNDNKIY